MISAAEIDLSYESETEDISLRSARIPLALFQTAKTFV